MPTTRGPSTDTVTRYEAGSNDGTPSGYAGQLASVNVPSCGIEDVDVAVATAFDEGIRFTVIGTNTSNAKKVPVVFASGERWAMMKRDLGVRDKNGNLILPLISIRRTGIVQDPVKDIAGRGMNQSTGNFVIKRLLSQADINTQRPMNRNAIPNDKSLAVEPAQIDQYMLASDDELAHMNKSDSDVVDGAFIRTDDTNRVWEYVQLPSPQFYTANYEVIFWTQYVTHMNQMMQQLFAPYLPTGERTIRISTNKGYWFVAYVSQAYDPENNFDDMKKAERIVKYKFQLSVPAYHIPGDEPGAPVATRSFVSPAYIGFDIDASEAGEREENEKLEELIDPNYYAQDPTLPRLSKYDQLYNDPKKKKFLNPSDPYAASPYRGTYINGTFVRSRITSRNFGERVFRLESGVIIRASNKS